MELINKAAIVAEIERRVKEHHSGYKNALLDILSFIDTLEVKEVDIASMADEYYDALMKEASVWMDEGTMGHCRLAYYNGCKDVLNKIRKGE
jgi:hypothetical protein